MNEELQAHVLGQAHTFLVEIEYMKTNQGGEFEGVEQSLDGEIESLAQGKTMSLPGTSACGERE
jgi:hypothetical protein